MKLNKLSFKGSNCFRIRIILSILFGKEILIEEIRSSNDNIEKGLNKSEECLLELIIKITNGTKIIFEENKTKIKFKPGILYGGKLSHDCRLERSISYFLEVLMCLAPFCKENLEVNLTGITNDNIDISVDSIKQSTIPLIIKCLDIKDLDDIQLKIISRGLKPDGGGHVYFKCPIRKTLKPIQFLNPSKIKRIRGIAFSNRVSPEISNRLVFESKKHLLKFIPDVYINTNHLKGVHSGKSPGYGLSLVAETINGTFYVGEAISNAKGFDKKPSFPEDVAKEATFNLFEEIYRGGCVSSINQSLVLLFMCLGHNDISKIQLGPLSVFSIQLLRHLEKFLQITFKLELDEQNKIDLDNNFNKGSQKIIATVLGVGYVNLSKTLI